MIKHTIIIAEAGVNHNGSLKKAKKLINTAKKCGADYVKFQYFKAEDLVQKNCELAEYQKKNSLKEKDQFSLLKKLQLSKKNLFELKKFAKKINIKFFCSSFSEKDIAFLNKINDDYFKIPSGENNNIFILNKVIKLKKKIIISTGATTLNEINEIYRFIKLQIHKNIEKKIILMHCISKYPTEIENLNLNFLNVMKKKFKTEIGFSDHTKSIDTGQMGSLLGCNVIEKHLTLSNLLQGPDHKSSLNPKDFKNYVKKIRLADTALGDNIKRVSKEEYNNKQLIRKSLVAKKNIKINDIFSELNITAKRPANGLSPISFIRLKGKKSKKNYKINELIK